MEKRSIAIAYIEGRLKKDRHSLGDSLAVNASRKFKATPEEHAQREAMTGCPAITAYFLSLATELTVIKKGELLSAAHSLAVDNAEYDNTLYPELEERYRKAVNRSRNAARGLDLALRILHKT